MKKKFILLNIALFCAGLIIVNAGNFNGSVLTEDMISEVITKEYDVKDFTALDIGKAFRIIVKQGPNYKVSATGGKEDIAKVQVSVTGNELEVEFPYNLLEVSNSRDITIEVIMPKLEKIDFGGASESTVSGFVNNNVDIKISGASTSKIDIKTGFANIDVSGASSVILTGETKEMKVEISGASSFNAIDFRSNIIKATATGASTAKVNVIDQLDLNAIAASSISYKGDPKSLSKNATGASSIRKVE